MHTVDKKRVKYFVVLMVGLVVLAGCAQTRWVNRTNPTADIATDGARCQNEALRNVPDSISISAPPAPQSTANTDCSRVGERIICNTTVVTPPQQAPTTYVDVLATTINRAKYAENCLISRGWVRQVVDREREEKVKLLNEAWKRLTDEYVVSVCQSPNLIKWFTKTTCNYSALSEPHLRDESFIGDDEKGEMIVFNEKDARSNLEFGNLYLKFVIPPSLAAQMFAIQRKYNDLAIKNRFDLYERRTTWGQYNTSRKSIANDRKAELDAAISASR